MIRPFCHVGVDYTSDIYVKESGQEKKYNILLFTCLNVHACHIELIPEVSTNHFVMALVCIFNEYGIPNTIYSNDAKSFITRVHFMEVFTSDEFRQ